MRSKSQITAVKIVVPDTNTAPANWVVKDYPNWNNKTKDDPSAANKPSNIDTPTRRSLIPRSVTASSPSIPVAGLVRRATDPQKPEPETDPNVSGTL